MGTTFQRSLVSPRRFALEGGQSPPPLVQTTRPMTYCISRSRGSKLSGTTMRGTERSARAALGVNVRRSPMLHTWLCHVVRRASDGRRLAFEVGGSNLGLRQPPRGGFGRDNPNRRFDLWPFGAISKASAFSTARPSRPAEPAHN